MMLPQASHDGADFSHPQCEPGHGVFAFDGGTESDKYLSAALGGTFMTLHHSLTVVGQPTIASHYTRWLIARENDLSPRCGKESARTRSWDTSHTLFLIRFDCPYALLLTL